MRKYGILYFTKKSKCMYNRLSTWNRKSTLVKFWIRVYAGMNYLVIYFVFIKEEIFCQIRYCALHSVAMCTRWNTIKNNLECQEKVGQLWPENHSFCEQKMAWIFTFFLGSAQLPEASFGRIFLLSCRGELWFSPNVTWEVIRYENFVVLIPV